LGVNDNRNLLFTLFYDLKILQKFKKYIKHILSLKLCSVIELVLNTILYYLLLVFIIIDNSDNNNLTLRHLLLAILF